MQVLRGISNQYANLFGGGGGEANEFYKRYGWIATINDMANNDRTKWDFYFDMNVTEFLNTASFYKDKSDNDNRRADRQ